MKLLFHALSEGSCLLNLNVRSMDEIIRASVEFLVQTGRLPENQHDDVVRGLLEREQLVPTVIGHACAVPHFYDDSIAEPAMVFVRLKNAANLGAPMGSRLAISSCCLARPIRQLSTWTRCRRSRG